MSNDRRHYFIESPLSNMASANTTYLTREMRISKYNLFDTGIRNSKYDIFDTGIRNSKYDVFDTGIRKCKYVVCREWWFDCWDLRLCVWTQKWREIMSLRHITEKYYFFKHAHTKHTKIYRVIDLSAYDQFRQATPQLAYNWWLHMQNGRMQFNWC